MFRESGVAFFSSLILHALAMAMVVGVNVAVCLRLFLNSHPNQNAPLARLYPMHWWGVALIFVSGILLLIAYPAKALTNPVFYLKFACLSAGLILARKLQLNLGGAAQDKIPQRRLKQYAGSALTLWAVTIFAGRFLAYTNSILLAARYY